MVIDIESLKQEQETLKKEKTQIYAEAGEILPAHQANRVIEIDSELATIGETLSQPVPRKVAPAPVGGIAPAQPRTATTKYFSTPAKARRFGLWMLAKVFNNDAAQAIIQREGISFNAAMGEDINIKGGYLVPDELSNELISLVEKRGVFRQESMVIPMQHGTLNIPRRTGGITTYFVGEADAITESDMTLDQVGLVLKKLTAIIPVSSELAADSIISVFDMLGRDIAYGMADKEDECGFNGDATSTYGGIMGIRQQLIEQALGGTASGAVPAASGLVRYGTGHSYANIGMDDLTNMIGILPDFAEANAKWYMSKFVWSYLINLMADAGGNTISTFEAGANKSFLGYPVVTVPVMPKASAVNQVCVLLGDLEQATTMGTDKAGLRIATSDSAYVGSTSMFETDQVAIRGIERFDVNVHDIGSTTEAGPVVGLISHTA